MMYAIRPSTRFQKDLKRIQKRGYDLAFLTAVIKKLAAGEELPPKNHDHQLGLIAICFNMIGDPAAPLTEAYHGGVVFCV